ncbi:hypothetical protein [Niallia sp. 03133]|uniref:hypothetical protein n=1 Tax=Niallia sp. 03133 TaxID=3458060 RepID=UPI004043EEF3
MKKLIFPLFVLAFIFSFDLTAKADEGHSDEQNMEQMIDTFKGENHTVQHEDNDNHGDEQHGSIEDADGYDSKNSSHEEEGDSNTEDAHSSGIVEDGHKEEGSNHHGPVVEAPPNYKVLGAYGAVNLSFILIGIWNKWFRRKGI